jgi:DNA-binding response OmpR family regulator
MARILVLDDDTDDLEAVAEIVIACGHNPLPAATLEEARAEFVHDRPDACILDYYIQPERGLEFARDMRYADFAGPILFLTDVSMPDAMEAMREVTQFVAPKISMHAAIAGFLATLQPRQEEQA